MKDRILINCIVGNERCDIQADVKQLPGLSATGTCYSLSKGGHWLAYICKKADGRYHSIQKSDLTQDDIDGIGEQIDLANRG